MEARGSVEQVYATGLAPGANVELLASGGDTIRTDTANDFGGILFRNVIPASNYRVRSGVETSGPLTVLTKQSAPPVARSTTRRSSRTATATWRCATG